MPNIVHAPAHVSRRTSARWLGAAAVAVLTVTGFVSMASAAPPSTSATIAGAWSPSFGLQGATGDVLAVAVSGSQIYIGGSFTTFGGQPTGKYEHVAEWTGSKWVSLGGGVNGTVYALTVLAGKVYAGGDFTAAGGVAAKNLAAWDGHSWSDVGGVATTGDEAISERVESLTTDGTSVYVGGQFDTAGSTAVNSIAAYTPGTGFQALGDGAQDCMNCGPNKTPGDVRAMLWANGKLYAAGRFGGAGGIVTNSFASWTSATGWASYGSGLTQFGGEGVAQSLAADPATAAVYVGGRFDSAGGTAASGIAQLSGSEWSGIGDITAAGAADVNGLAVADDKLYATGEFTTAGGADVVNFAVRTGTSWTQAGGGLATAGDALAATGSGVVVAGSFANTNDGKHQLAAVALWDTSWTSLGNGAQLLNANPGSINALAPDGTADGVWAAGQFNQLGAVAANGIGHWTGTAWKSLSTGLGIGTGAGGGVAHAMVVLKGQLYVAGQFDRAGPSPANNIARWDGTHWHALGSGVSGGRVNALAVVAGKLYAGGSFSSAGGKPVSGVAAWDVAAHTWSALPGKPAFTHGNIYALASDGGHHLYIGGDYGSVTVRRVSKVTPGLVRFDSTATRTDLARFPVIGGSNGQIQTLLVAKSGDLYIGGTFTRAGTRSGVAGINAARVAVWHAATSQKWAAVGAGTDGTVSALAISGGLLYATGTFTAAGGQHHPGIAAYRLSTAKWAGLGSGGLLGHTNFGDYGAAYGYSLQPAGAAGVWVGGDFVQAGTTPAGSVARWTG
jgi:hypothetical protein